MPDEMLQRVAKLTLILGYPDGQSARFDGEDLMADVRFESPLADVPPIDIQAVPAALLPMPARHFTVDVRLDAGGRLAVSEGGVTAETERNRQAALAAAEITQLRADLDSLGKAFEFTRSKWRAVCDQLAEKEATIDRLRAELDGLREVPVEYVTPGALEAAMTADPGREDGTVLRETGGERRAFQWRAAAREWVQVP